MVGDLFENTLTAVYCIFSAFCKGGNAVMQGATT